MPIRLNDALKNDAAKKAAAEEAVKKTPATPTEAKKKPAPVRKPVAVAVNIPDDEDEIRSRHVQLLMYPSLHEKAVTAAKNKRMSLNKYIETLIRSDLEL